MAWQETRSENLLNMTPGRGQIQRVALGAKRDGEITGLLVDVIADAGAYPHVGAWLPNYTRLMCTGTYRIPRVDFRARSMVTNTAPVGAYRGAGRPEATAFLERSMDLLAHELDVDPVEIPTEEPSQVSQRQPRHSQRRSVRLRQLSRDS